MAASCVWYPKYKEDTAGVKLATVTCHLAPVRPAEVAPNRSARR